jgi:hypothetical protein
MSGSKFAWGQLLVGILIVVGLPLVGHLARRDTGHGCALDGEKIQPIYRVEIVDHQGERHAFCCLRCAEIWVRKQRAAPQAILVTDETTGRAIDADTAFYVRSTVVTTPTTGNRIHVFAEPTDAEKHANTFSGTVLSESERPFR